MNNSNQILTNILQTRIINLEENQNILKNNVKELLEIIKKKSIQNNQEEMCGEYSQYSQQNDLEEKINLLQTENNFLKNNLEQNDHDIKNYKKQIESLETTVNVIKQLLKYI